jgi:hypothetical protein
VVAVWQEEEAQRHEPCGTYAWEWKEDPYAYRVEIEDCPACDDLAEMKKKVAGEHAPEVIQGWYLVLVPRRFADGE